MCSGAGRAETDELPVVGVAFQTNPDHEVDDLRVVAERDGDEVAVHVAARRAPSFTKGHAKTVKLVGSLLAEVEKFDAHERAYVAVAVAPMTNPHREVQRLATLAQSNSSEGAFFSQVDTAGRHADLKGRYEHLTGLVERNRPDASEDDVRALVWALLNRLWVVGFRVETDDESEWAEIAGRLDSIARDGHTGVELRDALHAACATQFDLLGVVVDEP